MGPWAHAARPRKGYVPSVPSMSGLRGERGQTSAEYVGMLLVVVAIMAAISYADIGAAITAKVDQAICAIATDAGSEDCGGETPSTASRGAPARAAPNLYAAEMAPVALRSLDGSDAVPAAPLAQAAPEKGALRKAFDFLDEVSGAKEQRRLAGALLAGDFSDFEDAARDPLAYLRAGRSIPFVSKGPLVDELSGLNDARQAIVSAADGDYGPALLSAAFAVPIAGKFLKGGKYAGQALAWLGRSGPGRALVARGRGALRRVLREERGSVGLPAGRGARGPSVRESNRVSRQARKRGVPIRNAHLAGKPHPKTGVRFKQSGFPDFTPYAREINGTKNIRVKRLTGDRGKDRILANRAAGIDKEPKGYVWNHVEDGKTMQLVPAKLHRETGHTGGAKLLKTGVVKPAK